MKTLSSKHIYSSVQFLFLFLILAVSAILFSNTVENYARFLIIFFDAIFYIFWGVWHHFVIDRINKSVIIEYVLVSSFIILLAALGLGIVRFF